MFFLLNRGRQYQVLDFDELSESLQKGQHVQSSRHSKPFSTDDINMQRISLDLMNDPEIQGVYKKSYSMEDIADADDSEDVLVNVFN